ncbi:unnamed protein product [Brassica rapa]|uniref:Knottin scorpion toxin-like domain-containing protein n=2 Tax=Brassica TaxID=3705 RepID=A0A3P6CTR5_BRACM|nr:unnamed protein product [Brassica napus]CAG7908515.1 unnamed protein product [Brassica rapa]CDY30415.1 BnaA04g25160D [Brassica napus]VDD16014.1 unnamed protein product [Brassica rapa]
MAMTTKPISSFAVFFIFFLVIFAEMPETEAQDRECLKEYGGEVGFSYCAPLIRPTFCFRRCREDKGAKGGECRWGDEFNVKCLCDFCSDKAYDQILSTGI